MFSFFEKLFDTADFPPRWFCGTWTSAHGWLHIFGDLAIFGAYFAIPVLLSYFVLRHKDVPFPPIFWLFAAFILSCGIGHLVEATLFWQPWYRLSGLVKGFTAVVSWVTVLALIPLVPKALALPGLQGVNAELRRTADNLKRSNEELETFALTTTRDLKGPLHAVGQLAQLIVEESGTHLPDSSRKDLALMMQRVERMKKMLDCQLEYSRIGLAQHRVEPINTSNLVREIVEMLSLPAGFTVSVANLPTMKTRKAPLEQVFRQLIGNAVKHHNRSEGKVEVFANTTDSFVEFVVRDDGPGIAPEYHELVFKMFQALNPRDQLEGLGMGLAFVKKIVETQGGRVWVESSLGKGAAFHFTWTR